MASAARHAARGRAGQSAAVGWRRPASSACAAPSTHDSTFEPGSTSSTWGSSAGSESLWTAATARALRVRPSAPPPPSSLGSRGLQRPDSPPTYSEAEATQPRRPAPRLYPVVPQPAGEVAAPAALDATRPVMDPAGASPALAGNLPGQRPLSEDTLVT